MAPNIESLTPEELDALEQAAMAQASAPSGATDLSKMSLEELDALEQEALQAQAPTPTDALQSLPSDGPVDSWIKQGLTGLRGAAEKKLLPDDPNKLGMFDDSPNSPKFMDRHPFARNMANLVLKDLPQMAAVGKTKIPIVGAGIGAGIRALGGGAYDNAEQFLQKLSEGDISRAFHADKMEMGSPSTWFGYGDGTSWLGQNPGQDALSGAIGGAAQIALPKFLDSQAARGAALSEQMGVGPQAPLAQRLLEAAKGEAELTTAQKAEITGGQSLAKAMGISNKDTSLLNNKPPAVLMKELFESKVIQPGMGPAETEASIAKLIGGSTITGERLPGTLPSEISGIVERIQANAEANGTPASISFGEIKNNILQSEPALKLFKNAEATKSSSAIKDAFDNGLHNLRMEAANRTKVLTADGIKPLGIAHQEAEASFEKLTKQEAILTSKIARLNDGPTTPSALTRLSELTNKLDTVTRDLRAVVDGKELLTGDKTLGLNALKDMASNPEISFVDVNNWKGNLYRQLKEADFDGIAVPQAEKNAIREIARGLKNTSEELAKKFGGGIVNEGTGESLSDVFLKKNRLYGNLMEFSEYLQNLAGTERENLVPNSIGKVAGDIAHAVASPKQGLAKGLHALGRATDLKEWHRGIADLSIAEQLKANNGVPNVMDRVLEQTPIIPKFIGLRVVDNLARSAAPYMEPGDANASEIDGLTQAIAAKMLSPEQLQDLEATQQAMAQAQQVLQPLNMARTHGTREDVAAEISLLTKEHPEVFAAPKTGIPGEVVIGGRVMFPHPEDGLKYSERVRRSKLGSIEKSRIMSDVHFDGTVSKIIK